MKMILGNKCDLTESRAVTTERGKEVRKYFKREVGVQGKGQRTRVKDTAS